MEVTFCDAITNDRVGGMRWWMDVQEIYEYMLEGAF